MGIFSIEAPRYWKEGIPAIPLWRKDKRPEVMGWQKFGAEMPDESLRNQWLSKYPEGNIGLPLGPCSGMVALDIDTDDPKVRRVIDEVLPKHPWVRVGQKGAVYMFKHNDQRTFRIKDSEGNSLVELLSKGTQVVLPPSIHPKTQQPYTANCDLLSVKDFLQPLPRDFETILRQALLDAGVELMTKGSVKVTNWVPAGGRDSTMVSMAGLHARAVLRGERTLKEALSEIQTWVENYTEQVVGDPLDPEKARMKVVEFIKRDVLEAKKILPTGWEIGLDDEQIQLYREEFGEDNEAWTSDQIQAFITEEFEKHKSSATSSHSQMVAVNKVIEKMARNSTMSQIEEAYILKWISKISGGAFAQSSLNREIQKLRKGEVVGQDHTEIARAVITEIEKTGEIRYHNDQFYQWRGSHWENMDRKTIMRIVSEEYGHLPLGKRYSDHEAIAKTIGVIVQKPLADVSITGVNFANGFLTSDLRMLEHEPKYGMTYVLPYRYMPELAGGCGKFLSMLDDCWGDDYDYSDKVQALRESMAATLFGLGPKFVRAICLYGVPSSGKTTIKDILLGIIPKGSTSNVAPQHWGDKFLPTMLNNKLLNYAGELSESEFIPGDKFKTIIEGEEIMGQYKGMQIFGFRPNCTHWFCTNHLPRTKDTSAGFNRRWLFLEFNKTVPPEKKIMGLADNIVAEEREAIVAWCIPSILEAMKRQDLHIPKSHETIVGEVANSNNSVRFFMVAGGVIRSDASSSPRTSESQLHTAYWSFCKAQAFVKPVPLKSFRLKMKELQKEFGFKIVMDNSQGMEQAWYESLTLVA